MVIKQRFCIIISVMLMVFVTGCLGTQEASNDGGDAVEEGDQQDQVTLRIASAETGANSMQALEEIGKEYEDLYGVKVEVEAVPLSDIFTKISATVGTSAEYDLFLTGYIGHIALLQENDLVVPLDDIIENIGGREDFESLNEKILFPIDDQVYWIPYDYNLGYGYIRTDWLEEKGLDVPKTWDDLIDVAEAFTDESQNQFGLLLPLSSDSATNWLTTQLLWSNDVEIFDEEWNVILDSEKMKPKVVETLNLLKDLVPYIAPGAESASYSEAIGAFTSGNVGITFYSGRLVDNMDQESSELVDNFEVFGFPTKDGDGVAATLGYDGIGVLNTERSEEAKKFTEWFYNEKIIDFLNTDVVHFFPAQQSIYESKEWRSLTNVEKYWETGVEPQYELLMSAKLHSIDSDGPHLDTRPGVVFESYVIPKMFQMVALNEEDPEQVVDEIADEIRDLIAE